MQATPSVKKIWRRLVVEVKREQASVCDPERLEQRRDLGVQQAELCWYAHRNVCATRELWNLRTVYVGKDL